MTESNPLQQWLEQAALDDLDKTADINDWRFIVASSICPECQKTLLVLPQHGIVFTCNHCQAILYVIVAPATPFEDMPPICAFQVRSSHGRYAWLMNPMFYDIKGGK